MHTLLYQSRWERMRATSRHIRTRMNCKESRRNNPLTRHTRQWMWTHPDDTKWTRNLREFTIHAFAHCKTTDTGKRTEESESNLGALKQLFVMRWERRTWERNEDCKCGQMCHTWEEADSWRSLSASAVIQRGLHGSVGCLLERTHDHRAMRK
jgi:hypothetical protein